jgi:cell division protease FtsH
MMGGRAAEELIFHDPSTGASNDIEKATKVARALVTQYGLSARVGTVQHLAVSVQAIEGFLVGILEKFPNLVVNNFGSLVRVVTLLSGARETLSKAEVADIFKPLKRWPERGTFTGSDKRVPSSIPPVKPPQIDAPTHQAPRG